MGEKKYYWLKLQNDFFSHKEIKKLRKIAGGDTYTVIYLKMLLVSLKNDGCLFYDGVEETFAEELALELDEEKDNVDVTLKFLMVHRLIEETSQNEFSLPGTINAIGAETSGNIRVKRHREKLKSLQCNGSVTPMKRIVNGEKESDIDKDIDKENNMPLPKKTKHKYGQYKNVLLTDEDLEKLKIEFNDWSERIERLSEYMASKGKAYKDHLATIRSWSRREQKIISKEPQTIQELMKGIVKNGGLQRRSM
jgi:predicted phage replisome organizer